MIKSCCYVATDSDHPQKMATSHASGSTPVRSVCGHVHNPIALYDELMQRAVQLFTMVMHDTKNVEQAVIQHFITMEVSNAAFTLSLLTDINAIF